MTDRPYETGFLEEIINVNFGGGNWLAVWIFPDQDSSVDAQVTFPDLRGMSPVVSLSNGFAPGSFSSAPHNVTKDNLKQKSFGVKHPITPGTPADQSLAFINLSGTKPIRVRTSIVDISAHGASEPIVLAMFSSKVLKEGYTIQTHLTTQLLDPSLMPGVSGSDFASYNSSVSFDWSVDPKALTVRFIG